MSQQILARTAHLNTYLSKGWKVVNPQPSGLSFELLLEHERSDPELRKDVARDVAIPSGGVVEKIDLPACVIPDVFKVWEKARTVEGDTRQQLGVFRVTFVHRESGGLRCILERKHEEELR